VRYGLGPTEKNPGRRKRLTATVFSTVLIRGMVRVKIPLLSPFYFRELIFIGWSKPALNRKINKVRDNLEDLRQEVNMLKARLEQYTKITATAAIVGYAENHTLTEDEAKRLLERAKKEPGQVLDVLQELEVGRLKESES